MILAAILRNFKCYKGINIIPFSKDGNLDCLNIIIGNNGVGKSAVLEGLDTLFNDAPWIVNKEIKDKKESSVGAVLLVEKDKANTILDSNEQRLMEEISEFFWTVDGTAFKQYASFFELRGFVGSKRNDHYLLVVGREYEHNDLHFLTFTSQLRGTFSEPKPVNQTLSKLLASIMSLYTYIHIPVETSISDFVKLQNRSFQTLMDSSVRDNISKELNNKRISRGKKKKLSLLEIINEFLEKYVTEVEADIQRVYRGYSYKPAPRQSSKLTSNHVVDTIISAYYSKRSFKKDGKEIQYLSSGEKRMILIDIISAFVKKDNPTHELIIAVDEPENSLHISKCYDQFQRIEDIALKYNHQLLVTTHWYGSLPCLSKGSLIHIDDNGHPEVFNLYNYYEKRGDLPEDVYLKGFFDLSSSLLYAFRASGVNWLLVEGYEDKKYLSYHLTKKNVRIIPLGGCGNVKKVYEYLQAPFKSKDFQYASKKILCLIDTDAQSPILGLESGKQTDILRIRRWNEDAQRGITLLDVDNPSHVDTEIEDILEPKQFFDALTEVINSDGTQDEKDAFAFFTFEDTVKTSRVKGDNSILRQNVLDPNIREHKKTIINFVDSHKEQIANAYTAKPYTGVQLSWVLAVEALLA